MTVITTIILNDSSLGGGSRLGLVVLGVAFNDSSLGGGSYLGFSGSGGMWG